MATLVTCLSNAGRLSYVPDSTSVCDRRAMIMTLEHKAAFHSLSGTGRWKEMAVRAWGSQFSAPDHRIYEFSNGRGFDSTDRGTTGIYRPKIGP